MGEKEHNSFEERQGKVGELIMCLNETLIPIPCDTPGIIEYQSSGEGLPPSIHGGNLWIHLRDELPIKMIVVYWGIGTKPDDVEQLTIEAFNIAGDSITSMYFLSTGEMPVMINNTSRHCH